MAFAQFMHRLLRPVSCTATAVRHKVYHSPHLGQVTLNSKISQRNHSSHSLASSLQLGTPLAEPSTVTIDNVHFQNDEQKLKVQWNGGESDVFPYIWLRDNCQCSQCFHPFSKARLIPLNALSLFISPVSTEVKDTGHELQILWSDGHTGIYPSSWLQKRSFSEKRRETIHKRNRFKRVYWGSEIMDSLPASSFPEILRSDEALLDFLVQFEKYGITIVQGAPSRWGEVLVLSERIGFHKRTHYGNTFAVRQKIDASNLAYTSGYLDMHIDMPYIYCKPEVQLLHCIAQIKGKGGENQLVDSLHVTQQLKHLHPEKFDILTSILVDFTDEGVEECGYEYHTRTKVPIISLDQYGELATVNFSHMSRDSFFDVPVDKVHSWYDAMLTFHSLLSHPDNAFTYKLKEGEILILDNMRVMHGRQSYHMTEGSRELEGCYWDWDTVHSCRRVIEKKFARKIN
ncbi:Gamma-butyrobetaine dioxygenase [Halocaridina rubra]|uniref:Gamma-butyrobetaine dioxygenase n=1 Tax=Halocaridina rubra TaxID=373956 RepID=A0AAN8WU94_HALRR